MKRFAPRLPLMTLAVVVAALVAGSTTVRAQPRDAFGRYHALVKIGRAHV